MRVRWHCGAEGCNKGVHEGEVWKPSESVRRRGESDYNVARRLRLVIDPRPAGIYVLVEFDDRPGTLQVHEPGELEIL
jgi:hypothetical protein